MAFPNPSSLPKSRIYMVTDVETTGRIPKEYGIITMTITPVIRKNPSQLVIDADGIAECYYTTDYAIAPPLDLQIFVGRDIKIDPKAMEVNGIDLKAHNDHPDTIGFTTACRQIMKFLVRTKEAVGMSPEEKFTWCGWSLGFDINMIEAMMEKNERTHQPNIGSLNDHFFWTPLDVKSIAMAAQDLGVLPDFEEFAVAGRSQLNLGRLAQHYGLNTDNLHSARKDVELTIRVLNKLMADLDPSRRICRN